MKLAGNLHITTYGICKFYFSYTTCVAVHTLDLGLVVSQNRWSVTTGKHLSIIDGGSKEAKAKRLPSATFDNLLRKLKKGLKVSFYGVEVVPDGKQKQAEPAKNIVKKTKPVNAVCAMPANLIPIGTYFTGSIGHGAYTGLFVRAFGSIVNLNKPNSDWSQHHLAGFSVDNYEPVSVRIFHTPLVEPKGASVAA